MTQETEQLPSPQALKQGYEPPDVSNRGLLIFFVLFIGMGVVVQVGLWWLTKYYIHQPRAVDTVISAAPAQPRFPAPNLQPIEKHNQLPWQDLQDLQREKNGILQNLGWKIDADTGLPVIPDTIVSELARERGQTPKGGGQ